MFDAENESMGSERVSGLEGDAPSSSAVGGKADSVSPPSGRQYLSLRSRIRFGDVFRTGVRRRRGGITVLSGSESCDMPAVGIVASKKMVGGAVDRNRAKRRIRAALDRLPLENRSYIVIASKQVLEAPFETLVRWLEATIQKESARE